MQRKLRMKKLHSWALAPAVLATASIGVSPVAAASIPQVSISPAKPAGVSSYDPAEQTYENHRYRRYRPYRHHRGPSLGDVLTGVLIIGGIAAIADSAKRSDDRRNRDRDYPDYRRDDARWNDGRGIDRAVSMCVDAVERDERVESVDRADRTANGWQVSGTVSSGAGFTCEIGSDGRVRNVDFGQSGNWQGDEDRDDDGYAGVTDDKQWDDTRYAAEWDKLDDRTAMAPEASLPADDGRQPSYPGGPLEGESEDDRPVYPGDPA